jgi:hypothetical protein
MERDDFQFAFQAELEASLRPEGEPTHEKAIMVKPADYPLGKFRYMLKGVSRQTASKLGISKIAYQGEVDGKRVGWTENIGSTARRKQRYHWIRARGEHIAPPNGLDFRQNKTLEPATSPTKVSKFEGGIRRTYLDAAPDEFCNIPATEKFGSGVSPASDLVRANNAASSLRHWKTNRIASEGRIDTSWGTE